MAELNPYIRNVTPQDEPEGQLAPYKEPGGHVIELVRKALSAMRPQPPDLGPAWGLSDIKERLTQSEGPLLSPWVAQQMEDQAMSLAGGTQGIVLNKGVPVTKLPENVPYKEVLAKFLDDPNVIVPYIPKSYSEPVVAKSMTQNIAPIAEAMGLSQYGKAKGFRTSLPEGSMLATTVERQKRTMPHEFGHEIQKVWQRDHPVFGDALNKESLDMFADLHPEVRDAYIARWGKWPIYNNTNKFANELTADFVNPESFARRFPDTISKLGQENRGIFTDLPPMSQEYTINHLKEALANRFPVVGAFWDEVPKRIPSNVYDLP
jgi:hypothetical protein